jgi:hypothetical protein
MILMLGYESANVAMSLMKLMSMLTAGDEAEHPALFISSVGTPYVIKSRLDGYGGVRK